MFSDNSGSHPALLSQRGKGRRKTLVKSLLHTLEEKGKRWRLFVRNDFGKKREEEGRTPNHQATCPICRERR